MQNKTYKNFIERLLSEDKISASSVGKSIKNSNDFSVLINGGFIGYIQAISGGGSYCVKNKELLEDYYHKKFPVAFKNEQTSIDNVHTFRNTKAAKRENQNVILIRGTENVLLNETEIDLKIYTENYGTFSTVLKNLKANKVCFVENLDSFLIAERVIDNDFIFIHTYGGVSKTVVNKIQANEILVFPDYDFVGLKNYLLIKNIFPSTKLFVPENYEELLATKSRTVKTKNGREQQPNKIVLESAEDVVVKIREDIFKHKKFVEQQAVFK
jgi:hypothetical protein